MKKIRLVLTASAILLGVVAALTTKANRSTDFTYYVTGQDGTNWKVTSTPISCNPGSEPCEITSTATPVNGEIPKNSVTQTISFHAF